MKIQMFATQTTAALLLALTLAACGGGGGSDAAGTAGTAGSSSSGTVTGFGSVFVDGVEIEDAKAYTRAEMADGSFAPMALQLGHRVRVARGAGGDADTVTVDAAVLGAVQAASIDGTALTFTVAGQSVKANADEAAGPVTRYGGGYTAFADIVAADLVEVHGSAVYDATAQAYVVQATRIEKKSEISAVRVMGKLANLDSTAKTFSINGLTVSYGSATLAPNNATLANDQPVAVWGAPGALVADGATLTLTASRVRLAHAGLGDAIVSGTTRLGGLVSNYDSSAGSFELEGVTILVGTTTIDPTGATIVNGAYVQVAGTVGADGKIAATAIHVRQQSTTDATAVVQLMGAIESLTDQSSFVVRGVPVDAAAIDLAAVCPNVTLAVGTPVRVTATAQVGTDVVLARTMNCPSAPPPMLIRGISGTAGSVDATARTFVLTSGDKTQTVQWSDQTVFAGVSADTLAGATLAVQGYLDANGKLVARMIRNPSAAKGRMDGDAFTHMAAAPAQAWNNYRNRPGME